MKIVKYRKIVNFTFQIEIHKTKKLRCTITDLQNLWKPFMNPSSFKIAFKHKEIRLFMSKDKKREHKSHFHFQELGVCWVIWGFFGKKKINSRLSKKSGE